MQSYTYVIENLVESQPTAYVGKANDHHKRWEQHQQYVMDKRKRFLNSHFYNALRRDGVENFRLYVVEECDSEQQAFEKECEWITYLREMNVKLYNKSPGGYGGQIRQTSDESRRKMSISQKIKFQNLELRKRISEKMKGRVKSASTCLKLSRSKRRPIQQFDLSDGHIIAEFESALEAETLMGACRSKICECVKGRRQKTLGFGWRYKV
jgi:group I intron endonuclease